MFVSDERSNLSPDVEKSCLELVLASLDISNVWLSSEICFLFHLSLKTPVLWFRDLLITDISPNSKNPTTKLFQPIHLNLTWVQ
jgi:hypothetical protein